MWHDSQIVSEEKACAVCGKSVPKTKLVWSSRGEVCAACERAPAPEVDHSDPASAALVPHSPWRALPLQIFGAIGVIFLLLSVGITAGIIFGFQLEYRHTPLPTTWSGAAGFFGIGAVSSLIAFGISKLMKRR
jgi:hypothetical protein